MNELTPGQGPAPQPQPGLPESHGGLQSTIDMAHKAARGQVAKLQDSLGMVDHVRQELGTLSALGEAVTPEDVIKGAGTLVGHGADPVGMAGLLADMPEGGQALNAWLQQQTAKVTQNEQQLQQQMLGARHTAATAALHSLTMNHISSKFAAAQQPTAAPQPGGPDASNALN